MKRNKGISLIVLVITIIVMIILAGAILLSLNNAGIIGSANQAVDSTNKNQVQVLADTLWSDAYLDLNGKATNAQLQQAVETGLTKNGVDIDDYLIIATQSGVELEKFNRENWEHAYTYTRATNEWSGRIEKADADQLTGDIIVKLYKADEMVEPTGLAVSSFIGMPITLTKSNAYKMVIEGTGDMGILATADMSSIYAWQQEFLAYVTGQSKTCVTPYITDVIIEDGVTNVGECAFVFAESLRRVMKGNDLEKIEFRAFNTCENLESINISSSMKKIGLQVFERSNKLTTLHVPSKEEWDNVVIGQDNYALLDAQITYDYRTKVERLANEGWQKAYNEGKNTESDLQKAVITYLEDNEVSRDTLALYQIKATTKGVEITGKETTLGNIIISGADYGKTVNYSANGINSWKVLYKQTIGSEEYVYLIASENAPASSLPIKLTYTVEEGGAGATFNGKNIYWDLTPSLVSAGTINTTRWLANWSNYATNKNGICITYFLDENYWNAFKNTSKYGDKVVGAIGTPTAEMIVASYNERSQAIGDTENSTLTLTNGTYGYMINGDHNTRFSRIDKLYTPSYKSQEDIWLASPSSWNNVRMVYLLHDGYVGDDGRAWKHGDFYNKYFGVRPVVCLNYSIPAYVGLSEDTADIMLK